MEFDEASRSREINIVREEQLYLFVINLKIVGSDSVGAAHGPGLLV